jgi:hypothetical protein
MHLVFVIALGVALGLIFLPLIAALVEIAILLVVAAVVILLLVYFWEPALFIVVVIGGIAGLIWLSIWLGKVTGHTARVEAAEKKRAEEEAAWRKHLLDNPVDYRSPTILDGLLFVIPAFALYIAAIVVWDRYFS